MKVSNLKHDLLRREGQQLANKPKIDSVSKLLSSRNKTPVYERLYAT